MISIPLPTLIPNSFDDYDFAKDLKLKKNVYHYFQLNVIFPKCMDISLISQGVSVWSMGVIKAKWNNKKGGQI